jgi:hypothetical protein
LLEGKSEGTLNHHYLCASSSLLSSLDRIQLKSMLTIWYFATSYSKFVVVVVVVTLGVWFQGFFCTNKIVINKYGLITVWSFIISPLLQDNLSLYFAPYTVCSIIFN